MRTTIEPINSQKAVVAVDTETLQSILMCGRPTAVEIGTAAGARVQVGRRVIWNVKKIQEYLDEISE